MTTALNFTAEDAENADSLLLSHHLRSLRRMPLPASLCRRSVSVEADRHRSNTGVWNLRRGQGPSEGAL